MPLISLSVGQNTAPIRRLSKAMIGLLLGGFLLVTSVSSRADGKVVGQMPASRSGPTLFSEQPVGQALPSGWIHQTLPGVANTNQFAVVRDGGINVLHVASQQSASTLTFALRADANETPILSWRWKVSRAIGGSDFRQKSGDDYAARIYVLFDLPSERLSLGDRITISTAKLLHGADIPAAALCYVWGNKQSVGERGWNPYTDRLQMIVLDSGNNHAGEWRSVSRDIAADFVAAFGAPIPPIAGIVVSADTDNTGEAVETLFGDIRFEGKQ